MHLLAINYVIPTILVSFVLCRIIFFVGESLLTIIPAHGQMNESWRQYYTTIGRYSTVSSNHIILEVTMCLFSDGEHLSCPVIRPTNFTNPGINRNNGHYTVATRIS